MAAIAIRKAGMELYQLRGFATVAELGQLTRAAEALHVSQPALSAQIKALEDELELTLFERSNSGMVLTAAGVRLLARVQKVLGAAQTLANEARTLKGELAGRASIGTLSDPDFVRLGEFMSAVVEAYPLLELELHQEITGVALERVGDGRLDASFYYGELSHPKVAGLALREITYRVAAPADWRERLQNADWKTVAEQPWIIPPPISSQHQLVHTLLRAHGVEPGKVVVSDHETVVSSLVVSGLGMALMREEVALDKAAAGEICLWGEVRVLTTLWFIYARKRENDPIIRAQLDVLRSVWNLKPANARKKGR
jgi:DNA-binding transcriptional LysR family regulator